MDEHLEKWNLVLDTALKQMQAALVSQLFDSPMPAWMRQKIALCAEPRTRWKENPNAESNVGNADSLETALTLDSTADTYLDIQFELVDPERSRDG